MDIGKAIHRRRTELGLTTAELGRRLNITHATVSRWESGKINVQAAKLPAIASALQTTVAELVGDIDFELPLSTACEVDPLLVQIWGRMTRKSRRQLVQVALVLAGGPH